MTSRWHRGLRAARGLEAALCTVALLGAIGALPLRADDKEDGEQKKPAAAAEESKPAERDPFLVPQGTPEQLLQYIESLTEQRPKSMDPADIAEYRGKMGQALLTAADRILAGKSTDEQAGEAIQIKIQALSVLERAGRKDAAKMLDDLPAELEKAGRAKSLVRSARAMVLAVRLGKAARTGPKELETAIGNIRQFLAQGPIEPEDVQLAMTAATTAEQTGETALAASAYRTLGELLAANKNRRIASLGAKMQGAARRLTIAGQPMEVQADKTFAGKPFDWAQYKGKVVLVQFWATWCGPCIREIENIRKNYEAYHDQGFEVVAISIDENQKELAGFLKRKEMPWTILHDEQPEEGRPGQSMATSYGVFGIPSLFLVGRDGKVVSTDVYGPQLGQQLERLLGPPKTKYSDAEEKKPKGDK